MATVTEPILLDTTGQDMVDALGAIADALELETTPATVDKLGIVKPDGDTISIDATGTISATKSFVAIPAVSQDTFTYSGSEQGIQFSQVSENDILLTGSTATNAGNYTCVATLKNPNAIWADGTAAPKSYPWTIQKAAGSVTLSASSITLNSTTDTMDVTATIVGDGGVSISSSDVTCVTVTPSTLIETGVFTIDATGKTGSATVTATLSEGTNYLGATASCSVDCQFVPMKTFAAATDAEIAQMVAAADAGQIDLYEDCGWRVGQEHTTTISSIASSGTYDGVTWTVGEAQSSQSVTFVLMHQGLYQLVTPVKDKQGNNRSTCSFVVGLKDSLSTRGYMNSMDTNNGSWPSSARRSWCNGGFRQAVPNDLRSAFKQFQVVTGTYSGGSTTGGSNVTSQDYFALAAEKEVFGTNTYCTTNESDALTQFTWYQTTANRVKKQGTSGSAYGWWERSLCYSTSTRFCLVFTDGSATNNRASTTSGLAPFGCL